LPVLIFGAVFGINYLEKVFHMTKAEAGFINVLLFVGATLGSPAFGWLSDIMRLRKRPMYIGAIACLLLIFMLMYIRPLPEVAIGSIFFLLGFFSSAQVVAYPAITENNPANNTATALSLGSMINMMGGIIPLPLFGFLLDFRGKLHHLHQVGLYSVSDYRFALWLLPISFLISIGVLIFARETRCVPMDDNRGC
jgi:MFS family permease